MELFLKKKNQSLRGLYTLYPSMYKRKTVNVYHSSLTDSAAPSSNCEDSPVVDSSSDVRGQGGRGQGGKRRKIEEERGGTDILTATAYGEQDTVMMLHSSGASLETTNAVGSLSYFFKSHVLNEICTI